jgi:hypothetical protein
MLGGIFGGGLIGRRLLLGGGIGCRGTGKDRGSGEGEHGFLHKIKPPHEKDARQRALGGKAKFANAALVRCVK